MEQQKRISRTYVLPEVTADAAKSLAAKLDTNVSQLVEVLLEKALEAVATGRWTVEAYPTRHNARVIDRPLVDRK